MRYCFSLTLLFLFSYLPVIAQDSTPLERNVKLCDGAYETMQANEYAQLQPEQKEKLQAALDTLQLLAPAGRMSWVKGMMVLANDTSNKSNFKQSNQELKLAEIAALELPSDEGLPLLQSIYSLYGYNYEKSMEFHKGIFYSEKARQLAIQMNDWFLIAQEHNNLCVARGNLGAIEAAIIDCQQCQNIADTLTSDFSTYFKLVNLRLAVLNSYGVAYNSKAENTLIQGRKDLSRFYTRKAISYWNQLIAEAEKIRFPFPKEIIYTNLGANYLRLCHLKVSNSQPAEYDLEHRDSAIFYLENIEGVLLAQNPTSPSEKMNLGVIQIDLASAYILDDFEKGLQKINEALALFNYSPTQNKEDRRALLENSISPHLLISAIGTKAALYSHKFYTDPEESRDIELLEKALNHFEELISFMDDLSVNSYFFSDLKSIRAKLEITYGAIIRAYLVLYETTKDITYFQNGLQVSERIKSFILRQEIRYRYEYLSTLDDLQKEFLQKQNHFEQQYRQLQSRVQNSSASDEKLQAINDILDLYEERDRFMEQLKQSGVKEERSFYYDRYNNTPPDLFEIKNNFLSPQQALIEFCFAGVEPMAIVVTRDTQFMNIAYTNNDFWRKFDYVVRCQNNAVTEEEFGPQAYKVYQILMEKTIRQLPPEIKELIIVPDNILRQLSFEALPMQAPGPKDAFADYTFLLDSFAISYTYSMATLAWSQQLNLLKSTTSTAKMMGAYIASPSGEASRESRLNCGGTPLEYMKTATIKIMQDLGTVRGDLFPTATKAAFLSSYQNYRLLHFAMHGCIDTNTPLDYYLQFTPDEYAQDDNALRVKDIYELDLNAKLVVLGSCDTKKGELEGGEGIASIARAFTNAGCENLIATLNAANDYSTSIILEDFYRHLFDASQDLNTTQALAAAKRAFLRNSEIDDQYKSPYYWANLISIGKSLRLEDLE